MINIINYNLGNIRSLANALTYLGVDFTISGDHHDIKSADALILPGVGSFEDGMSNLKVLDLINIIREQVISEEKPILGICLGMQMLFESSEEFGSHKGIGIIEGEVKLLPNLPDKKLPNVGWYSLINQNKLVNVNFDNNSKFYFNHGYYCKPKKNDIILFKSSYGNFNFCSSFKDEYIMGSQFHPEKSSHTGLNFLKMFLNT